MEPAAMWWPANLVQVSLFRYVFIYFIKVVDWLVYNVRSRSNIGRKWRFVSSNKNMSRCVSHMLYLACSKIAEIDHKIYQPHLPTSFIVVFFKMKIIKKYKVSAPSIPR